jgi:hypothetical protein
LKLADAPVGAATVTELFTSNTPLVATVLYPTRTLPLNVLVAVVLVAVKYWPTTCPATDNFAYGLVVPMPTLPLEFQIPEPGKYALPDTVRAVVDAYGNVDARVVEVAVK